MRQSYKIVSGKSSVGHRQMAEFLAKEGQLLLPMVDLIEQAECAVDEVIDVMGRATIEAVLRMSAEQLAGPRRQGKRGEARAFYYHGTQQGRVALKERQLRVDKPRLRKKRPRPAELVEVELPAYEAMRKDGRLANRMLAILPAGVSTRKYKEVLPEMAEQVGISKSQVSRENIEAGERLLKDLAERDFSDKDILVVYIKRTAARTRSSDAAITSGETFRAICQRISTIRPRRPFGRPGSLTRSRANRRSSNTRLGSRGRGHRRPPVFVKAWTRCSRSIG